MIFLESRHVIAINEFVTRGQPVRDLGAVESACGRPQATAFGEDAYPGLTGKAAALLQSLARNHAFIDGNKRTAWLSAMAFLDVNGHALDPDFDVDTAESLMLAVATGAIRDLELIAFQLLRFMAT